LTITKIINKIKKDKKICLTEENLT